MMLLGIDKLTFIWHFAGNRQSIIDKRFEQLRRWLSISFQTFAASWGKLISSSTQQLAATTTPPPLPFPISLSLVPLLVMFQLEFAFAISSCFI